MSRSPCSTIRTRFGISHSTTHRRFTAWNRADFWRRRLDAMTEAAAEQKA
ncbi:hypothetical protein [Streptomyces sp. NPDC050704]